MTWRKALTWSALGGVAVLFGGIAVAADAPPPIPVINLTARPSGSPSEVATSLQILALLTVLTLAPAILVLMTSFTRIVIVLALLRQALGVQNIPPNQVLIGLSIFLTFFVMQPVGERAYQEGLQPYLAGRATWEVSLDKTLVPVREFMLRQTREKDLALFVYLSKKPRPHSPAEVSTLVLVPAFVISELRHAFEIGFIIYLPFLVIDLIVASALMSMGMLMLPPVMISLPFKLLLFVLVDGWHLMVKSLVTSFH